MKSLLPPNWAGILPDVTGYSVVPKASQTYRALFKGEPLPESESDSSCSDQIDAIHKHALDITIANLNALPIPAELLFVDVPATTAAKVLKNMVEGTRWSSTPDLLKDKGWITDTRILFQATPAERKKAEAWFKEYTKTAEGRERLSYRAPPIDAIIPERKTVGGVGRRHS